MRSLNECNCGCGGNTGNCMSENDKPSRYMFMQNLETIRRAVDAMLEMDPDEVDALLNGGHDWASDHVATSKDDIEEVAGFLINSMQEPFSAAKELQMGDKRNVIHTFESFSRRFEDDEMSDDEILAKKLMSAFQQGEWNEVKSVASALRYRAKYGYLPRM